MTTPNLKDWLLTNDEQKEAAFVDFSDWVTMAGPARVIEVSNGQIAHAQLLKAMKGVEEWLGSKAKAYGASNVSEFHEWAGVMSRLSNELATARTRLEDDSE